MTSTQDKIEHALQVLSPVHLDIIDQSEQHRGHAGHRPGEATHFDAVIVSAQFEGLSLRQRHQMVYQALGDLMRHPVHAFSMKTLTPDQFHAVP